MRLFVLYVLLNDDQGMPWISSALKDLILCAIIHLANPSVVHTGLRINANLRTPPLLAT